MVGVLVVVRCGDGGWHFVLDEDSEGREWTWKWVFGCLGGCNGSLRI